MECDHSYRLYNLCDRGSIRGATSRLFEGDREALDHASQLLSLHPAVEVWQTNRLVGRVERQSLAAR